MPFSSLFLPSENRNGRFIPAATEENHTLAERKLSRKLPPSRERDNRSLSITLRWCCIYTCLLQRRFGKHTRRHYVKKG